MYRRTYKCLICVYGEEKKKPVQMNQREKKGHYFERKKKGKEKKRRGEMEGIRGEE